MLQTLLGIVRHPLNRGRPLAALTRFARWQFGTRLLAEAVAVPFVDRTRLLVYRGMTGATGNVYCGLHEFEDMAFVLHVLRRGDLFVDVGANIGSYTVLAGGACGADCVCIEPVPTTFARLLDNLRLNDLMNRVESRNIAVGRHSGTLQFTSDLDTVNHAVSATEASTTVIQVPVEPLDSVVAGRSPTLIKVDVEGFETSVIDGASATLRCPSLLGVLMELNGCGQRYGFSDDALHAHMLSMGFTAARYDPAQRRLRAMPARDGAEGNVLYIRNWSEVESRLAQAPRFRVLDTLL